MRVGKAYGTARAVCFLVAALATIASTSTAWAGGGEVQPPQAKPRGYSLAQAAEASAAFNAGTRNPNTLPDLPFQVLYLPPGQTENTFVVKPGTSFYVPLEGIDDSPPILGDFPADVSNQEDVEDYVFDPQELGGSSFTITVDGNITELGPDYVAGVTTEPLPDGGGTHYIAIAAFLTPLPKGKHTVTIAGAFDGAAFDPFGGGFSYEITYTVIVR